MFMPCFSKDLIRDPFSHIIDFHKSSDIIFGQTQAIYVYYDMCACMGYAVYTLSEILIAIEKLFLL